jgi:hypothetical protein
MRTLLLLLILAALASAEPLDRFFFGRVVSVRGRRVTLSYDFEEREQLKDFESVEPPGLLASPPTKARIEEGRLVLGGSVALRHRAIGRGEIRAVVKGRLKQKGNVGALLTEPDNTATFRLLNLFDHRIRRDGKLRWSATGLDVPENKAAERRPTRRSQEAAIDSQPVFVAEIEEVGKRVEPGAEFELEVYRDRWLEGCRIGSLHRWGSADGKGGALREVQFGFWVHGAEASFDDLVLTVELTEEFVRRNSLDLKLAADFAEAETSLGKLFRRAQDSPLSVDAATARRELSRRGEEGWKKLASVVKKLARKRAYAGLPAVRELANGDEPERRELLLDLFKRVKDPEVRAEVLHGLAPWYPDHAELIHEGLKPPYRRRIELLRALLHRGIEDEVLKPLTEDPELADEVFEILKARDSAMTGVSLDQLAQLRALEAYNAQAALDFRRAFAAEPNWELAHKLIELLDDKDDELARGAYLLLLTISGKEIAPDRALWNSWLAARESAYEPPELSSAGVTAAAVLRGRDFLLADLAKDGLCVWPNTPDWPGCQIGATSLAVLALRVSGIRKDHPVLDKAIKTTLLDKGVSLRSDMQRYTYALSLLLLALHKVDAEKYRSQIEELTKRIIEGQLDNGQWTYHCHAKGRGERPEAGDNSNTQYAILALRAARRVGIAIDPGVWRRCAKFWRESPNPNGGWGYGFGTSKHELSMTAAGIATLSICVEAMMGEKAGGHLSHSAYVAKGHQRLGELVLADGYRGVEIYAMYGVERACVLTGVRAYNEFDWYHEGAAVLVGEQKENGAWGDPEARGVTTGAGYGEAIDTAYAILFLKLATTAVAGAGEGNVIEVRRVRKR